MNENEFERFIVIAIVCGIVYYVGGPIALVCVALYFLCKKAFKH